MSHLWLIFKIMGNSRFYSVKNCIFLHSSRITSLVPCEGHWCSLIYRSAQNVKSFYFKRLLTIVNELPTKKLKKLVASPLVNYSGVFFTGAVLVHSRKNMTYVYCESLQNPKLRQGKQKYNDMFDQKESEPQFDWQMFFHLLKPEMWFIVVAVVSAFVVALLNTKIPSLLGDIVNVVSRFARNDGSLDTKKDFLQTVKGPAVHLVYLYLVQSLFTFVYISTLSCAGERLACRIRQELFTSILKQDVTFFDVHRTGEVVSRLTIDVQDFKSSFKMCISQGFRSFTQTAGCVISLYLISPKMTAIMLVAVPAIILTGTTLGTILRSVSKLAQEQGSYAAAVADEAIGNIRTVRAFAMEHKEEELYNHEIEEVKKLNTSLGIGIGAFQGLTNLALNGIVLGVMYIGGSLMSSNELSPGSLMSFLVATQTIQRSLAQMSLLFGQFVRGMAAGARLFQYINMESSIPLVGGVVIPENQLRGEVEFKNVSFTYPTRPQQLVLENFSLHIPAGKMVAICGPSGGGKSTVAALLERFYDVDSGSITLDGKNLDQLDPKWLRGHVLGFINQEPVLFATSVMENIRYGRPDATDSEVIEAAKLANADEFICSFPNGYSTVVGERGVTVSGGQKQRIAIARALLKNPSIIILDEATSALDSESEKVVQEALDRVTKGRTVLVIAHRLSTIQNADIIAVLAGGFIAEVGTHKSLKKHRGLYWDLIRQQQLEEEVQELVIHEREKAHHG